LYQVRTSCRAIENLPWKSRLLGKRYAVCETCTAERSKRLYEEDKRSQIERVRVNNQRYRQPAREYAWEYLSTHPYTQCGETDPVVLEFHHNRDKVTEVSRLIGRGASIEVIQREIAMQGSRPNSRDGTEEDGRVANRLGGSCT